MTFYLKQLGIFKGLAHRIEKVGIYNGVLYVNDSKATNVSATRQALKAIAEPTILLAGGFDKKLILKHFRSIFLIM